MMTTFTPLIKAKSMFSSAAASYKGAKQNKTSLTEQFNQITLISYHIPKTAGTSFKYSLEKGLGKFTIQYAYKDSYFKELSEGEPVWCWPFSKVLHGHFRYHENQNYTYPNAAKIVWLREPAERAWSLMNHWLRVGSGRPFNIITELVNSKPLLNEDLNALFQELISDQRFHNHFAAYQFYLKNLCKSDFFFVGNSDDFDNELKRLAILLKVDLPVLSLNQGTNASKISDQNRLKFKREFTEEYDLYEKLIF